MHTILCQLARRARAAAATIVHIFAAAAVLAPVVAGGNALAAQRGELPYDDPHLRALPWESDQVYLVQPLAGRFTDFQMNGDERILEFYLSDSSKVHWRFIVSRNQQHVLIKPVLPGVGNTLMIITSRHTYQVTLLPSVARGRWDQRVTWTTGPDEAAWTAPDAQDGGRRTMAATPTPRALDTVNADYTISGSAAIRPLAVFDDGHVTKLQFPASLQEMPVVLVAGADGEMTLPNWTVQSGPDGTRDIVVQQLFTKAVLHLGNAEVDIDNHRFPTPPAGQQVVR